MHPICMKMIAFPRTIEGDYFIPRLIGWRFLAVVLSLRLTKFPSVSRVSSHSQWLMFFIPIYVPNRRQCRSE